MDRDPSAGVGWPDWDSSLPVDHSGDHQAVQSNTIVLQLHPETPGLMESH